MQGAVGAHGNAAPHGNAGGHGNAGAPREPILYDMIEVLPEPRAEPESESEGSESEEESESEDESESDDSEYGSGKESGENEIDISGEDDETIPHDATVEPSETFVSAPSSPQPQQPAGTEPRAQRVRKPPPQPFDPRQGPWGGAVSAHSGAVALRHPCHSHSAQFRPLVVCGWRGLLAQPLVSHTCVCLIGRCVEQGASKCGARSWGRLVNVAVITVVLTALSAIWLSRPPTIQVRLELQIRVAAPKECVC
jgi:hypothetical protein